MDNCSKLAMQASPGQGGGGTKLAFTGRVPPIQSGYGETPRAAVGPPRPLASSRRRWILPQQRRRAGKASRKPCHAVRKPRHRSWKPRPHRLWERPGASSSLNS